MYLVPQRWLTRHSIRSTCQRRTFYFSWWRLLSVLYRCRRNDRCHPITLYREKNRLLRRYRVGNHFLYVFTGLSMTAKLMQNKEKAYTAAMFCSSRDYHMRGCVYLVSARKAHRSKAATAAQTRLVHPDKAPDRGPRSRPGHVQSSRVRGKRRATVPIHLAPERHHEIGDPVEPFPSPSVEFRRLAVARRQRWSRSRHRIQSQRPKVTAGVD